MQMHICHGCCPCIYGCRSDRDAPARSKRFVQRVVLQKALSPTSMPLCNTDRATSQCIALFLGRHMPVDALLVLRARYTCGWCGVLAAAWCESGDLSGAVVGSGQSGAGARLTICREGYVVR